MAFSHHKDDAKDNNGNPDGKVKHMLPVEPDRRARNDTLQFTERNQGSREGDRTNRNAKAHFNQAGRTDIARRSDAIGTRRIKCCTGDKHRRQTDQRVEGRNKLWQGSHLDLERDDGTDGTTDQNTDDDGCV